ncbi:TonB-dependent receptor [Pseudoalteromonas sp. SG44-5]|uniref:TonB-dependent receptor n=1 Tax=Pseudoalteromonas sp. SG44-5 TaxID=2760960 RepID=UPI0015FC04CE|nr:TonB-dependent receptor [Pseudoalteromonas sp. SG44-5]MBB1404655.1 TonB-dependent receptor [Pseudoalteromonas sp. SG44-5]
MKRNIYINTLLAGTFGLLPLSEAISQELSADKNKGVEVIQVTGIRQSIITANEKKRSSENIVDGISAEDLGVFPDANVAESLQRITGVSIDRSGGEGRFITVRGLGPEFNTVLANGRILATENAGREFSLDVLPADLINGATVYKSYSSNLTEGAIGGTVDITTWRPFDINETKVSASIAGTYDTNAESYDMKGSALFSTLFNDDMGFLASLSYNQRTVRIDSVFSDGYVPYSFDETQTLNGEPANDVLTLASQRYQVFEQDRERIGGTLVYQWKPNDDQVLTIDGLFSIFNVEDSSSEVAFPFSVGRENGFSNVVVNNSGMVQSATKDGFVDVIRASSPRDTTTYQVGLNHEWQISNNLKAITDIAYSEAKGDGYGKSRFYVTRAFSEMAYSLGSDFPLINTKEDLTEPNIWSSHVVSNAGNDTQDNVLEAKLDFEYIVDEMGYLQNIDFGFYYSEREKDQIASRRGVCGRCFNNAKVTITDPSIFNAFEPNDFLSEVTGDFASSWINYDFDELVAYYQSEEALSQLSAEDRASIESLLAGGAFTAQRDDGATTNVQEDNFAAYVQLGFAGDNWDLNLGARYIQTDLTSTGQYVYIEKLINIVNPDGSIENRDAVFSDPEVRSFESDYDEILPSANFKWEFMDVEGLIFRASYSDTITRPTISSLSTSVTYNINVDAERVNAQNPNLQPFKSQNYDVTLEWYMDDSTTITLAGFQKKLSSFLTITTEPVMIEGVQFGDTRPRNGGEGEITGIEVAYQQLFDQLPEPFNGLGIQANYTNIDSTADYSELGGVEDLTLEGLSEHNANLILFYERDAIKVRLAYNYRSDYLSEASTWLGGPKHVDDFGQLDFRASYDFADTMQVYFEGVNITNETLSQYYNQDESQKVGYEDFGSRYALGIRAQF